jgi:hypothetical protein
MGTADRYRLLGNYRTARFWRLALAILVANTSFAQCAFGFPLVNLLPPPIGPYANAHVGDWVSFKSTAADTTTKRSVVRRTAVSITIRHEGNGKNPLADRTIEFTGPKANDDAVVEVLDTGKDLLTVAGKKYDCEWTKTKTTYPSKASLTALRAPIIILRKNWICKDVCREGASRSVAVESDLQWDDRQNQYPHSS